MNEIYKLVSLLEEALVKEDTAEAAKLAYRIHFASLNLARELFERTT